MANRFFVGGNGNNWHVTSGNTNWATSSGGAANATEPGTSDVAIFDASSPACTVNLAPTIQGLDCQGGTGNYANTLSCGGNTFTINSSGAGAFRLSSGMTFTSPGSITFTHTSGTANLTSAGQTFPSIVINGAGGTTQQQDNLLINAAQNSALQLTSGTFDMNGFSLTCPLFQISGSTTRAFKMGSTLTVGGNISNGQTIWNSGTTTNLTLTKNSCAVVFVPPITNIAVQTLTFGSVTLNNVTFNSSTTGATTTINTGFTCSTLTIGSGLTIIIATSIILTVSGLVVTGTAAAPTTLFTGCTSAGTEAIISCASACTAIWAYLQGMQGNGGGTFTATNSFSGSLVSGWTINPPADGTVSGLVSSMWTDLLSSSDFSTAGSVGALLKALVNLQYTVQSIGRGTVTTGASTTSIPTSAFSPSPSASVAGQLDGRVVLFDWNTTTVALRGQVASISASTASATPTLTVSALTATPASGDTFSVL